MTRVTEPISSHFPRSGTRTNTGPELRRAACKVQSKVTQQRVSPSHRRAARVVRRRSPRLPRSSVEWDSIGREISGFGRISMGHRVDDIVDAEFVSFIGMVDWIERMVRPLPVIPDVVVEIDHYLKAFLLIENSVEDGLVAHIIGWNHIERFYLEEALKHGLVDGQDLQRRLRQHLLDAILEVVPLIR